MALNQLGDFMAALGQFESGGDYGAVGVPTKLGRALGRYQIMSQIWPGWAAASGIPGADWRDPAAQDHVARWKMTQYYNTYGSWELVAVAWFAGPGSANKAARSGIASVAGLSDVLGTNVGTYIQKVINNMGGQFNPGGSQNPLFRYGDDSNYPTQQPRFGLDPTRPARQVATEVLSTLSNAIRGAAGVSISTGDVNVTKDLDKAPVKTGELHPGTKDEPDLPDARPEAI